jgi:hypothetical protein
MGDNNVTTDEIMDFLLENMVTKEEMDQKLNSLELKLNDAMDDKLLNLKGDLINVVRKEDRKLIELVALLKKKKVLSDDDVRELLALEPFPQMT